MSNESLPVTVQILDKEYRIACPENEQNDLLASANYLNGKMREIRDGGKVIGVDRVAVMAALNMTHEYLSQKSRRESFREYFMTSVRSLQKRIDSALEFSRQLEL